ncbi:MAG: mechanosensitive ion channel family protein [Ketobacteraceae bacterium]|nr:mechanosensitive ion channel family protein [Ketobacteraceae bacterium]
MFRFLLVVWLFTVAAFLSAPLQAQAPVSEQESSSDDPLTREDISSLVETLEDDASREKFLDNLKTLQQTQDEFSETKPVALSESLSLDKITEWLISDYLDLLQQYGLTKSSAGAIITVAVVALILALGVWANSRLSFWFDHRLESIRLRYNLANNRFALYFKCQRIMGYILALVLMAYAVFETLTLPESFREIIDFAEALKGLFILFLIIFIFVTIWESVNGLMEFAIEKNRRLQSARAQTLIPIIRNLMLFLLLIMAFMVLLSELGVDIVPLLAGAGVVGIAVGFGAQKLVKDFLNGITIILEDLLQIGDIVSLAGNAGVVERITIRKIQLRGLDGAVYTIPFGDVNIVTNLTKDFSYYLMDIGVAYRESTDEVCECLKEIDEDMRNSEEFGNEMLEPLEILGVDRFADSAVVIRARLKTMPKSQWRIGREFNRRMKQLFDERNIEIPFPHQTLYFGQDKDGKAPSAPVQLIKQDSEDN